MLMTLLIWCEPSSHCKQLAVAVDFDDGVDVLEQADDRAVRLDLAEDLHGPRQEAGMLAEDGDMAGLDDAMHDLMDDRAFARALRAVEEIAAAMQVAVLAEAFAERTRSSRSRSRILRGQAVGEIDEVVDLQIAGHQLHVAVLVEACSHRRPAGSCGAVTPQTSKTPACTTFHWTGRLPASPAIVTGRRIVVPLLVPWCCGVIGGLRAEVVQVHGSSRRDDQCQAFIRTMDTGNSEMFPDSAGALLSHWSRRRRTSGNGWTRPVRSTQPSVVSPSASSTPSRSNS